MIAANSQTTSRQQELSPVEVKEFRLSIVDRWDRWLESCAEATPFHSIAWMRALKRSFGYEPRYLYAERNGRITGVLPLFLVSNWIMGRCLISAPFADYGGTCAEDEASADALVNHAKGMALQERVEFLELRHRSCKIHPGFSHKSLYVAFSGDLLPDYQAMFNRLPRDTRYMIRKGEKSGLELRTGVDQELDAFYKLLVISWRRFGTPVFSRNWLNSLVSEFHDSVDLKLAYHKGKAVAGVLSLSFGKTVFPHYAGAAEDANRVAANNFLYWQLMKDAASKGIRRFDFGRSKRDTGPYRFKSSWNMEVATLDYETFLVRRKDVPNFSPVNPKFQIFTRMWSQMPIKMTTWIGPRVVRWFP